MTLPVNARDLLNRWGYLWRKATFHPQPGLHFPAEPWETLFPAGSEAQHAALRLQQTYGLDWPDEHANQVENLNVVGLLELALLEVAAGWPDPLNVLDIGAKDWHYVPGMARLLRKLGAERTVSITGIEIDPYLRYRDGFTRFDYAKAYSRLAFESRYRVGDARTHEGAYDLVTLLYPLWREEEVLAWGLPGRFFDIRGLLGHARRLLAPGGVLLVSAFETEAAWAEAVFEGLGWRYERTGAWRSPFLKVTPSRWWRFPAP